MSKWCLGLLLVGLLLAGGCDERAKQRLSPAQKVLMKADTRLRAGDTNGALTMLARAMTDRSFAQSRDWLYGYYLNLLLAGGRADEARAHYRGVIGKDEAMTRAGFPIFSGYYQAQGEEARDAWIRQMMQAPLPADLLQQVYAAQVGIFLGKGQIEEIAELTPACISNLGADANRQILGGAVEAEIAAGRYDNAGTLLDAIEKHAGSVQTLKDLAAMDRADILLLKEDWAAADARFIQVAPGLADGDLSGWFPRVVGRCVSKGRMDLADKFCEFVLKTQKDKVGSRNQAAAHWVKAAKARKDVALIPVRLEALKEAAIPVSTLFSLYRDEFYTVLGAEKKPSTVAMMTFGEKLEALLLTDEDKAQVRTMALDGTFVVEDYAGSLKLLEAGIAGRSKNWHEMAINKAKAHLALLAGNYKEAVENFRKFMGNIDKMWERPEQDPVTGVMCSKEMCLGRNAKRIGDIWAKSGDAKAAADAYAEAKGLYGKALADVAADSDEAKAIQKEVGEIPGAAQ